MRARETRVRGYARVANGEAARNEGGVRAKKPNSTKAIPRGGGGGYSAVKVKGMIERRQK